MSKIWYLPFPLWSSYMYSLYVKQCCSLYVEYFQYILYRKPIFFIQSHFFRVLRGICDYICLLIGLLLMVCYWHVCVWSNGLKMLFIIFLYNEKNLNVGMNFKNSVFISLTYVEHRGAVFNLFIYVLIWKIKYFLFILIKIRVFTIVSIKGNILNYYFFL